MAPPLEPLPDLSNLSDHDLKELIEKLTKQGQDVSFQRRLVHGKIDILRAELVARLPRTAGRSVVDQPSTTLGEILTAKPSPATIPEVIERMRAIDSALHAADGVAWFTKLYLEVTQAVGASLVPAAFRDPAFLTRLDVVFANLFFEALLVSTREPAKTPKAWVPLIEARGQRRIAPIQFALAGMNAHINRDLPVALVSTCEELGIDLDDAAPEHADFAKVNSLLAATEARVKAWFATGFAGVVDAGLGNVDDRIAMWDVASAREAAWVQAQTLWTLRAVPPLRDAYLVTLDRLVGFAGRGLLVPVT